MNVRTNRWLQLSKQSVRDVRRNSTVKNLWSFVLTGESTSATLYVFGLQVLQRRNVSVSLLWMKLKTYLVKR
jgi:hypothetical protein